MNRARLFLKSIATLVTVAFLGLTLQPLALAANAPSKPQPQPRQETNEEKLSRTLEGIEKKLDTLEQKLTKKEDATKEQNELKALKQDLEALDVQALKDFDQIEQHLKDKKLPQVILDRHLDAVKQYQQEMATLKANLQATEQEPDDTKRTLKVKQAKEHLKAKQKKKGPKTKFDPNDLPHKALEPNPNNKPKLKKEEFVRAGLHDNPYVKVASHGGTFTFDKLAGANDPAYLAPTVEVVLTDAIRAKANELEHHPVKIYNWVRNNVEWLPTWGASQDADITLGSQRGNAFDIASLLIALYRASGIPARYVHGTIDVPEDKFRNWAGGFTDIKAAGDYAASGGIPVTAITTGGKITKIRMEHIWVEAAIDFQPSRGAINKAADSWVAIDPSYKQYTVRAGLNFSDLSGLDGDSLAQSLANSGTTNAAEGWAQNIDANILLNAKDQAATALQSYVQNQTTSPQVGDIIGDIAINQHESAILPTGLPNRSLVAGARYGSLPQALQNRYDLGFGIDILGDVNIVTSFPLSKVNNRKLTLSFRPSSAADEAALASLLPDPLADPSQLPSSIPSYLVYVTPEIALEGQVLAQGAPLRLGEELQLVFQFGLVSRSPMIRTYNVIAGSYLSLSANRGSVSSSALEEIKSRITATQNKLDSGDQSQILSVNRQDVLGDMYHAGTLNYWSQYILHGQVASLVRGTRHSLAAGFGSIGVEPHVNYFFGFPRSVSKGNDTVNIWVADNLVDLLSNADARRDFQQQMGMTSSALENSIPAQMFNTPGAPVQGISAVEAIKLAASQGQRIYRITQANRTVALPNLRLDGLAMTDINNALNAGREVVAHTDRISIPGFIGEGYILWDPVSGAGTYKITGGRNGGESDGDPANAFPFVDFLSALMAKGHHFKAFVGNLAAGFLAVKSYYQLKAAGCNTGEALTTAAFEWMAHVWLMESLGALIWPYLAGLSIGIGLVVLIAVVIVMALIIHMIVQWIHEFGEFMCKNRQQQGL